MKKSKHLGFKDSKAFKVAAMMPKGLKHYPDKTKPFSFSDSQVFQWLLSQSEIQHYIFDKVNHSGAIKFDHVTETWFGVNKE